LANKKWCAIRKRTGGAIVRGLRDLTRPSREKMGEMMNAEVGARIEGKEAR